MIELATAATVAGILANAISSVDKVYDWWRERKGLTKASVVLMNDPARNALAYRKVGQEEPVRIAMTYNELAGKLSEDDVDFIEGFARRMKRAMEQWNTLNGELPLASPVERARIEGNMDLLKERDICPSLKQIIDFIYKIGIDLEDHYSGARQVCKS